MKHGRRPIIPTLTSLLALLLAVVPSLGQATTQPSYDELAASAARIALQAPKLRDAHVQTVGQLEAARSEATKLAQAIVALDAQIAILKAATQPTTVPTTQPTTVPATQPTEVTAPAGYTVVAAERESFTFAEPVDVAYGASGKFNRRYNVTGRVTFSNEAFGPDPIVNVKKWGSYRKAAAPPLPAPTSQPAEKFKPRGRVGLNVTGLPLVNRAKTAGVIGNVQEFWNTGKTVTKPDGTTRFFPAPRIDADGAILDPFALPCFWVRHPSEAGTYLVSFDGKATLTAWGENSTSVLSDVAYNDLTNRTTATWKVATTAGVLKACLNFGNVTPANPVRDVDVRRPEHVGLYFDPDYMALNAPAAVWRSMDVQEANGNTDVVSHETRPKLSDPSYVIKTKGAPIEIPLMAARAAGAAPYVHLPTWDDNEASIRAYFQLIKELSDPALPVYVEYGNEQWNRAFASNKRWEALATVPVLVNGQPVLNADGTPKTAIDWSLRYKLPLRHAAWRAKIGHEVFADQPGRLKMVLGCQAADFHRESQNIAWMEKDCGVPAKVLFQRVAIAPYQLNNSHEAAMAFLPSPEAVLAFVAEQVEAPFHPQWVLWANWSRNTGIPLIGYEGHDEWPEPDRLQPGETRPLRPYNGVNKGRSQRLEGVRPLMVRKFDRSFGELGFAEFLHLGSESNDWDGGKPYGLVENRKDRLGPKLRGFVEACDKWRWN